jgi:enoyl-CoA hydratase
MSRAVVSESRKGAIYRIAVDRPKNLNALNSEVLRGLADAFTRAAADRSVRAILLEGEGDRAFIAGADIAEMSNLEPAEAEIFSNRIRAVYAAMHACPQPIVAAIDGFCLGGGVEIAIVCDYRMASDRSRLGLPEVTLGIFPGAGGVARLSKLVSPAVAKRLCLTGEIIDAETAARLHLVDQVVPAAEFAAAVAARMERFAAMSPKSIARIKEMFRTLIEDETAHRMELMAFAQCFVTRDQREGMAAFIEKRPPVFPGD